MKTSKKIAVGNSVLHKETIKFKKWTSYFLDKSNKKTHGNATQSALLAYNVKDYNSASCIGYQNYRKLQNLKLMIAEQEGFGIAEFIKVALAKALKGNYSDWEKLGTQLGYFEEKPAVIQNNQFNFEDIRAQIIQARKERGLLP